MRNTDHSLYSQRRISNVVLWCCSEAIPQRLHRVITYKILPVRQDHVERAVKSAGATSRRILACTGVIQLVQQQRRANMLLKPSQL